MKGILRYLKATKNMCICYGSQDLSVMGYIDSDYARDLDNIRSTSGYVFTMAGGAVSWRSRLQTYVTQSTTKVEYVAALEACKEAIWLGRLVTDLGIKEETPILHCDSQSAIYLARNPVYHSKKKHVDVKYHFIKEMVEDKQVQLVKVHTIDNHVDFLTKGFPGESFAHYCKLLSDWLVFGYWLEKADFWLVFVSGYCSADLVLCSVTGLWFSSADPVHWSKTAVLV
ncbi:hypothetical protein L7F22_065305 [Adiantum nelumboides]|nr:hypothetical protein [Adiantum nelumboides]